MHLPESVRWVIVVVLALTGGWVVVMNYACVIAWYTQHKHSSTVPLFGGLFLTGAMLICPVSSVRAFAWLPLLVDIGCLPLLVQCVYFFGIKKGHKP